MDTETHDLGELIPARCKAGTAQFAHNAETPLWTESEVRAMLAAERKRWEAAMHLPHDYQGACPDALQPDARDPECAACRALLDLGPNV